MFPTLQLEILDRFTAVEKHFRAFKKKGELGQIAKGLAFVQIHAIYEYTAKEVMRIAIHEIASHGHHYADLKPSLLAVFLHPQLESVKDSGKHHAWERRIDLFQRRSEKAPIAPVLVVPSDGSYFKHTQAQLILKTLGVKRTLTRRRRHLFLIDEVVENRNKVSHGTETAAAIGKRYSRGDIIKKLKQMRRVCLRMIAIVSEHCSNPDWHCS